jgi:hypothetical protein
MPKKSKKSKSKRQTLKQKYKVIKKVKEHHKKKAKELRKQVKAGRKPKAPRDPGIPSQWPFKQELVKELEWQKQRILATEKQKKAERRAARVRAAASRPPAPPCSLACEGRAAFQPPDATVHTTPRGPPSETLAAEGRARSAYAAERAGGGSSGPHSLVCAQVVEEAAAPGRDEDMAAADGGGGGGLSFEDVQREAAAKQRAYETTTAGPSGRGAGSDTAGAARAAPLPQRRPRAAAPAAGARSFCGCTCGAVQAVQQQLRPLPSIVRGSRGCTSGRAS